MSNNLLKQEEIDALLNAQTLESAQPETMGEELLERQIQEAAAGAGFAGEQKGAESNVLESGMELESLTDSEKDALGEIGNICMGSASTTLSMLLNQKVNITSPRVTITRLDELFKGFTIPHMTIYVSFVEGLSGYNLLILKLSDAAVLADLMMGGDGTNLTDELTEIGASAASEAMNQMIGSASTAMATMFSRTVNISPPETKIYHSVDELKPPELGHNGQVVVVWFKMTIGDILDTQLMQVMGLDTAREEANLILGQLFQAGEVDPVPFPEGAKGVSLPDSVSEDKNTNLSNDMVNALFQELPESDPVQPIVATSGPTGAPAVDRQARSARPPVAMNSEAAPPGLDQRRLDLILDIPLKVTVLLGRTKWPIKDILGLIPGSVVELQSLVDEPVEVLVNGTLVAKGEVVVVNENFGVRLTNIIGPEERIQHLGRKP